MLKDPNATYQEAEPAYVGGEWDGGFITGLQNAVSLTQSTIYSQGTWVQGLPSQTIYAYFRVDRRRAGTYSARSYGGGFIDKTSGGSSPLVPVGAPPNAPPINGPPDVATYYALASFVCPVSNNGFRLTLNHYANYAMDSKMYLLGIWGSVGF